MSVAPASSRLLPRRAGIWIKICGLTTADAVAAALEARVDAIGFVFAPSVRRLPPRDAVALAAPARGRCALIAVTLHPTQSSIDEILEQFQPDVLQADLADFESLRLPAALARLPVVRDAAASSMPMPTRVLFEGLHSGSGRSADWAEAGRLARESELILAGGLGPANVTAAIHAVRPFGVDVSSGVEYEPGRKSPRMIAEFVQAARRAARELA